MRNGFVVALIAVVALGGCANEPTWTATSGCPMGETVSVQTAAPAYANPIFIPLADPDCAWETIVAVVETYFRIEQEEPVRLVGNTLTEGHITTALEVSPTIFEPWRHDTVSYDERVENTLQSMRRRVLIRVIPAQGGHWVDLRVFKYLEDLPRPEQATAGAATFRYDSTLSRVENPVVGDPVTQGWIAKGRDASLEQYMIGDLLSRCGR